MCLYIEKLHEMNMDTGIEAPILTEKSFPHSGPEDRVPGSTFMVAFSFVSFISDPLKRLQNHIPRLDSHQEKIGNT